MAGRTPRFQFNYFGSGVPGTPNDDGQKFFGLDRALMDRLLAQVETHDHKYRPPTTLFADPMAAQLNASGGMIQGGYTYYYRYSVVDEHGNESIAGPEVAVATPGLLSIPGLPSAFYDESTPGTLRPGIYYYALTALRGTEETPIGQAALVQVQPGEGSITLDLPQYGEADALRVWRMSSTEPGYTRVGLVSAPQTQFVDTGAVPADPCACDPGNAPPAANTGTGSYSISLDLPSSVDLSRARAWRLYRTMFPGAYPTASLVHEVVERENEWDDQSPLLRSWEDVGLNLQVGKPMDADLNMRFAPLSLDIADGDLPLPGPYPAGYPIVSDGVLYVKIATAWVPVGGGSSGGGSFSGVMTSPGGNRFILSVDDDGQMVTTPTDFPGPPPAPTDFTFTGE